MITRFLINAIHLKNSSCRINGTGNVPDDDIDSACASHIGPTEKHEVFNTGKAFFAYSTPVILLLGLVGNSLSLMVFTSKNLRKLSASSYLAALSVADLSTLLFYVLIEWLRRGLTYISPQTKLVFLDKDGCCQFLLYMSYISRLMSSWIIVVFTIERFTGVCYPLKTFRRGAKRFLLSILLTSCILSVYKPILSGEYTSRGITACSANPNHEFISFVLDSVYAILITLIPFIVITTLNILIVRKLFLRNRLNRDIFSEDTRIRLEFTIILLAISFFFVAFNLPFSVVWARNILHSYKRHSTSEFTPNLPDYWTGVLNITRPIFYMNYCINFILYNITGKSFRKALVEKIACESKSRNKNDSYIKCRQMVSCNTTNTTFSERSIHSIRSDNV
ncbi:hypothetical protein ACF0H5_009794 [Mactra antiquata]